MTLEPVDSSAITAMGWEDEMMMVRYKNGSDYIFNDVSYDTYMRIRESGSIGKALHHSGLIGGRV